MGRKELQNAKFQADDEYLTQMETVAAFFDGIHGLLRGKRVFCNCDRQESAFVRYFAANYERIGLAGLNAVSYPSGEHYRYKDGKLELCGRAGNGSFYCQESVAILRGCDFVATNPPFSIIRMFTDVLLGTRANFAFLAPVHFNHRQAAMHCRKNNLKGFIRPNGEISDVGSKWCCSSEAIARPERLVFNTETRAADFPRYDNFPDAINVDKISDIPADAGLVGLPISIYQYDWRNYFELVNSDLILTINGKILFRRVLFRRK